MSQPSGASSRLASSPRKLNLLKQRFKITILGLFGFMGCSAYPRRARRLTINIPAKKVSFFFVTMHRPSSLLLSQFMSGSRQFFSGPQRLGLCPRSHLNYRNWRRRGRRAFISVFHINYLPTFLFRRCFSILIMAEEK